MDLTKIKSLDEIPNGTRFNDDGKMPHWMNTRYGWSFIYSNGAIQFLSDEQKDFLLRQCHAGKMFLCDPQGVRLSTDEGLEGRKWHSDETGYDYLVEKGEIIVFLDIRSEFFGVSADYPTLDSFRAAIRDGKLVEIIEPKATDPAMAAPQPKPEPSLLHGDCPVEQAKPGTSSEHVEKKARPIEDSTDKKCECGHAMDVHDGKGRCTDPSCECGWPKATDPAMAAPQPKAEPPVDSPDDVCMCGHERSAHDPRICNYIECHCAAFVRKTSVAAPTPETKSFTDHWTDRKTLLRERLLVAAMPEMIRNILECRIDDLTIFLGKVFYMADAIMAELETREKKS